MGLSGNFHHETHFQAGCGTGTAETVDDEEFLVGEFSYSQCFLGIPRLVGQGLVVIPEGLRSPPEGIFGYIIYDNEFVLCKSPVMALAMTLTAPVVVTTVQPPGRSGRPSSLQRTTVHNQVYKQWKVWN